MVVVATNDGQLHFFDGGTRETGQEILPDGQTRDFEVFNDGTGVELFAYMPRLTMPILREQINGTEHVYSLDGTLTTRDVFIDPAHESGTDPVDADDREWSTVLMSGLRAAGTAFGSSTVIPDFYSGYFALDATQPDVLEQRPTDVDEFGSPDNPPEESLVPVPDAQGLPSCLKFGYTDTGYQTDPTNCDYRFASPTKVARFPSELWTFIDAVDNHMIGPPFFDEDLDFATGTVGGNGVRDLGDTWSQPAIGMLAVCKVGGTMCDPDDPSNNDDLTILHVAVFGGGMDPDNKAAPTRGKFLYMVDMETGETIYKKEFPAGGAAPAAPAVIDKDSDGIFDAIYIGTTAGTLYKVNLDGRDASGTNLPALTSTTARDEKGVLQNVLRLQDDGGWDPIAILETYNSAPIYLAATAFRIPETGHIGIAVGTGDRHDLWDKDLKEGRFYVIVDESITVERPGDPCETRVPIEDACLTNIAWDSAATQGMPTELENPNLLLNLDDMDDLQGSRSRPSSGSPPSPSCSPACWSSRSSSRRSPRPGNTGTIVCSRSGLTRSFVVQVQNANPLARLSAADQGTGGGTSPSSGALKGEDRYLETPDLATPPLIDEVTGEGAGAGTVSELSEESVENAVREAIIDTFPRGSRYNPAISITIEAITSTTGLTTYVTIPIVVAPADWRESLR